ncbi:P-loop containing nucleoside triphosphate hydrolase protein [Microthyrium microscopicum]|uniref:DNA 3'-5' helicase n=1 Tax=Microthyrium microscopicum TaxID=703497 RepID=A0A6A6UR92_9PEZI|nr:P-loop containing nucleoside triphosphate hydrolase protein [Microthyrium microscopicum]
MEDDIFGMLDNLNRTTDNDYPDVTASPHFGKAQHGSHHSYDQYDGSHVLVPSTAPVAPRSIEDYAYQPEAAHHPSLTQPQRRDGRQSLQSQPDQPLVQGIRLVSTRELPDKLRAIFPFPNFNAVQSKSFSAAWGCNDNLVLSSPTGSGKTAILELAICRLINSKPRGDYKIVYQAPTKSLCSERHRDWQRKFEPMGLTCTEVTGDTEQSQLTQVRDASIIITTPEKWDSMTRRWTDHAKLMRMVKLFLIDEVHMLKDDRGATLEAVVSRMKSIDADVRFLALSATIPNAEDIALWLGKNSHKQEQPAILERFGQEFRPVRLQKVVCGYRSTTTNMFAFDKMLASKLQEVIQKHSRKKPIMVFCSTRKNAEATAKQLAQWWKNTNSPQRFWTGPRSPIPTRDKSLQECVQAGVAFHHAGLDVSDRTSVEQNYLAGEINVICCTSTLAVGVNLPCHFVIIKGTTTYTANTAREISDLEALQMLGRAGRPQFDTSAIAVIMTREEKRRQWEKLVSGDEILESCLHLNLTEHMNAEVVLGTITNLKTAKQWLKGTFLFVRMQKNPKHYRLGELETGMDADALLARICTEHIQGLQEYDCVTETEPFKSTAYGEAMAQYYILFETIKKFLSLPARAKISEILSAMSQADEFKDFRFRAGEKPLYKELNKLPGIRFQIPQNLETPPHKVSLIIQSALGGVDLPTKEEGNHTNQYLMERSTIMQQVKRLARCIADLQIHRGDAIALRNTLMVCRSVSAQGWDDRPVQMKQVDQIGIVSVRKLVAAGIKSLEELEEAEDHKIESALSRAPPFGKKIHDFVKDLPKLRISLKHVGRYLPKSDAVVIKLEAEVGFLNDKPALYFRKEMVHVIVLIELSDGTLAYFERLSAKKLGTNRTFLFEVQLTSATQSVHGHVMCADIAGTLRSATCKPTIPAAAFPKPVPQVEVSQKPQNASTAGGEQVQEPAAKPRSIWDVPTSSTADDEYGNAEDDAALLKIAERPDSNTFEDIDDIMRDTTTRAETQAKPTKSLLKHKTSDSEFAKLPNGKYACIHLCKDKANCRHVCCREGLDKPTKAMIKKAESARKDTPISLQVTKKQDPKNDLSRKLSKGASGLAQLDLTSEPRESIRKPSKPLARQALDQLHAKVQKDRAEPLANLPKPHQPNTHLSFLKTTPRDEVDDEIVSTQDGLVPLPKSAQKAKRSTGHVSKEHSVFEDDEAENHAEEEPKEISPKRPEPLSRPAFKESSDLGFDEFEEYVDWDKLGSDLAIGDLQQAAKVSLDTPSQTMKRDKTPPRPRSRDSLFDSSPPRGTKRPAPAIDTSPGLVPASSVGEYAPPKLHTPKRIKIQPYGEEMEWQADKENRVPESPPQFDSEADQMQQAEEWFLREYGHCVELID